MNRYYFELLDEDHNDLGVFIADAATKATGIRRAKKVMKENGIKSAELSVSSLATDNLLDLIPIELDDPEPEGCQTNDDANGNDVEEPAQIKTKEEVLDFVRGYDFAYAYGAGIMYANDPDTSEAVANIIENASLMAVVDKEECMELADEEGDIYKFWNWNEEALYVAVYD